MVFLLKNEMVNPIIYGFSHFKCTENLTASALVLVNMPASLQEDVMNVSKKKHISIWQSRYNDLENIHLIASSTSSNFLPGGRHDIFKRTKEGVQGPTSEPHASSFAAKTENQRV